jgi:hypothetical protein
MKCGKTAETVAGTSSLSEGAVYGKGSNVISTVSKQCGGDTKMMGSSIRRGRRWFHLNRSHGCKVVAVHSLGRKQLNLLLTSERSQLNGFGRLGKTEGALRRIRFRRRKTYSAECVST